MWRCWRSSRLSTSSSGCTCSRSGSPSEDDEQPSSSSSSPASDGNGGGRCEGSKWGPSHGSFFAMRRKIEAKRCCLQCTSGSSNSSSVIKPSATNPFTPPSNAQLSSKESDAFSAQRSNSFNLATSSADNAPPIRERRAAPHTSDNDHQSLCRALLNRNGLLEESPDFRRTSSSIKGPTGLPEATAGDAHTQPSSPCSRSQPPKSRARAKSSSPGRRRRRRRWGSGGRAEAEEPPPGASQTSTPSGSQTSRQQRPCGW
mmetsp:Transcript_58968/g.190897  ORF Transcript_58968/g.190897 Transcript_58968/m.190897 type:complete len:258 (-) Transcript_58968:284-1057(-)